MRAMLYPNRLQAALLFDRRVTDLEAIMRAYTRIEGMRSPVSFNMPESNPGLFYRLYDAAEDLMVTFEYIERPCNPEVFRPSLASPYTGFITPDIRDRIARTDTHILLEVSHGVLGGVENDPKIAAMFESIGRPPSGATQPQFERRLQVLALMARIVIEHAMPLAVHWTQSDMLLKGELFDGLAADTGMPGPLHIHPQLFGPLRPARGEAGKAGIRTFGVRHWLGREVLIEPSVLPWAANFEVILAFLRVATMPGGYVIPDGDTFGPEDRSLSYRVLHHDAGARLGDGEVADMPLYELVPMKHVAYGFLAPDHVPDANVIDDRAFPPSLMPADQEAKMELANEFAEKRKLAEGIGGQFEVRHVDASPPPPPPSPPPPTDTPVVRFPGPGGRGRVFGRKRG